MIPIDGTRLRDEGASALVTRRLLAVAVRLTAFGVLLYKDCY
jgi:hypothetical protein